MPRRLELAIEQPERLSLTPKRVLIFVDENSFFSLFDPSYPIRIEFNRLDGFTCEQIRPARLHRHRLIADVRIQHERLPSAFPLDREDALIRRIDSLLGIRRERWVRPFDVQLADNAGEYLQAIRVRLQLLDQRVMVDRRLDAEQRPIINGRYALEREQDAMGRENHVDARLDQVLLERVTLVNRQEVEVRLPFSWRLDPVRPVGQLLGVTLREGQHRVRRKIKVTDGISDADV